MHPGRSDRPGKLMAYCGEYFNWTPDKPERVWHTSRIHRGFKPKRT